MLKKEMHQPIVLPIQIVRNHFGQVTNRFFIRYDQAPTFAKPVDKELFEDQFRILETLDELLPFALALDSMLRDTGTVWNALQGSESDWDEEESRYFAMEFFHFLRQKNELINRLLLKGFQVNLAHSNYNHWVRFEAKDLNQKLHDALS